MKFTTLTVYRGTGPINGQSAIASDIVAQIDQKSLDMGQFDRGASPFDLFDIEAWTWLIQRNDHLVDAEGIVYTVNTRVETFPDGRSEMQGMVSVGS